MFDWSDAHLFLAVQRSGSLSAAARELRVEQSTVGRRLTALEANLGTRLFERTRTGLIPTPAGTDAIAYFEQMEAAASGAELALGGREARLSGTIRLTAPELFGTHLLTALLARFQRRHPQIRLELVADNRALSLSRREADLALRLGRPTQAGLVARKLCEVGTGLYGSKAYLEELGVPAERSLGSHRFIGYDGAFQPAQEARWLIEHTRTEQRVFVANSPRVVLAAAQAGVGLALLPTYVGEADPGLVRCLGRRTELKRELWLLVHRDLRHAARIRALLDFLAAEIPERVAARRKKEGRVPALR